MGSYVERYWISDASGMNKAERIGGAYRPSVPDSLMGFEFMMDSSCVAAEKPRRRVPQRARRS